MYQPLFFTSIALLLYLSINSCFGQNLTIYRSETNVEETTNKLVAQIQKEGLVYLKTVYYDEKLIKDSVCYGKTRLVLFEDSDLVADLLSCRQTTALDLPLKILVWEENGDVYIGFVDPKLMSKRFLLHNCDETLDQIARLMIYVVNKAIRSS